MVAGKRDKILARPGAFCGKGTSTDDGGGRFTRQAQNQGQDGGRHGESRPHVGSCEPNLVTNGRAAYELKPGGWKLCHIALQAVGNPHTHYDGECDAITPPWFRGDGEFVRPDDE